MRAADAIVKVLHAHGVERVYCVPGESYLTLLDALYGSEVDVIVCRHESGAGFMALAEARLTGRPGVCLVSRGPGATNASIAVHVSEQDAVPMILLIGQVSREERYRGAFQEVDYSQFFGGMAKAVYEINDGSKVAELTSRSMRLAAEGTPGPVIISMPEDMLRDEIDDFSPQVYALPTLHHGADDLRKIQDMINLAERPIIVAGAVMRGANGTAALLQFSEAQRIPVAVTWKNQDVFDNTSDLYAGHIGFGNPKAHREILAAADLIIAVGTRLGDVATLNYSFPKAPAPVQSLIHIHNDGRHIGRVFETDLGLVADPVAVLLGLSGGVRVVSSAREQWVSRLNGFVKEFQKFVSPEPVDGVDFGAVVVALAAEAPRDTIIATDAGNMSSWVHRHWKMTPQNTLLGAIAGAMGFGVPAAVAASLIEPARMVICFVGDGGVLMTGQELATAMQCGGTPKIVISDNGIYGTIRTHQENHFPGRVSGTNLVNPDFGKWAESFGAARFTLALGDDIAATVSAFLNSNGPAVLHVKSSKIALSAFGTLREIDPPTD